MALPPGPGYLLWLFPYFAIPSAAVYLSLRLLHVLTLNIPTWLVIAVTLVARPTIFLFNFYVGTPWADKRGAVARGAILPPVVQESSMSIIPRLLESTRTGYPNDPLYQWGLVYGTVYEFDVLTSRTVVTVEPEHIKAILATQFDDFEKGPQFRSQMSSLLGTGVFNADGEMWKFHRSMTRPFFTRERISDFEIYDRNCDVSLTQAKNRLAEGHSIDFQDLVSRFTLDSATEFLFGKTVASLSAGIPYSPSSGKENPLSYTEHASNIFVTAFQEGQILSMNRMGFGWEWPLAEFWKDQVAPLRKVVDDFTSPVLAAALEKREQDLKQEKDVVSDEDLTLLAHLVKHTQDPKILKDELVNLLVAGRDTTMCLLTYSFYMLAEHPDVEKRLREEIFNKVGPTGRPTYDQMRDMKFMRAFLNEVLRLFPPVPADARTNNKAVVLPTTPTQPKPLYIPAWTTLVYSVLNMQRRTDLWGPDAMKFDPDRFLDERLQKHLLANPYIFCPFNAGPRICLGQQFAYHEATFYLVRLLQQFTGFSLDSSANVKPPAEWVNSEGRKAIEKIHPCSHLTMYVKGGLWVRMKELNSTDV